MRFEIPSLYAEAADEEQQAINALHEARIPRSGNGSYGNGCVRGSDAKNSHPRQFQVLRLYDFENIRQIIVSLRCL